MQSLNWYWRRIRSMDGPEIAWRIKSLLRDQVDAVRIPLGLIPKLTPEQQISLADFKPGFRCSPVTHDDWQGPLSEKQAAWKERLLKKADLILDNRLSYFDLEAVHHGDPINWHRDHSAGIDSPVRLSVRIDYRDFRTFGDCKLVWEPNRHHQLVVLGRAYVAANERKYAAKVAEILRCWIDANPFGYGMNWKSPLELGVRLINWVWAIDLIRTANVFDDKLWQDIMQNVHWAIWDCDRKYSRGSSANNHLIGEAAGVYVAACYFHQLPKATHWRESAKAVLEKEIIAQTYSDGCTREHAFGYQFFVIQFFLLCMRAGAAIKDLFSDQFRARLLEMFRFMDEISADTGRPPNMGDSDDGFVLDLGEQPRNAMELISVGAFEYDRPELVSSADSETVLWLYGISARDKPIGAIERQSQLFSESGYAILRSKRMSVFFDCAELGYGPIAAHGHADCLSFCLSVDGIPVFIDPGTYDYFTYPEWREYFRSTRAHNTIEVNGQSQSKPLGPFIWGEHAISQIVDRQLGENHSMVAGIHNGYSRSPTKVIHERKLELCKESSILDITDRFSSDGPFDAVAFFHLAPGWSAIPYSNGVIISFGSHRLNVTFRFSAQTTVQSGNSEFSGWISDSYHFRHNTVCFAVTPTKNVFSNKQPLVTRISVCGK